MISLGSIIADIAVVCMSFILGVLFISWFCVDDEDEKEYENLKKTVAELKKEVRRISALSDRISNVEIDLDNHKKDCNMVGTKLEVVELLEDRIARLEKGGK